MSSTSSIQLRAQISGRTLDQLPVEVLDRIAYFCGKLYDRTGMKPGPLFSLALTCKAMLFPSRRAVVRYLDIGGTRSPAALSLLRAHEGLRPCVERIHMRIKDAENVVYGELIALCTQLRKLELDCQPDSLRKFNDDLRTTSSLPAIVELSIVVGDYDNPTQTQSAMLARAPWIGAAIFDTIDMLGSSLQELKVDCRTLPVSAPREHRLSLPKVEYIYLSVANDRSAMASALLSATGEALNEFKGCLDDEVIANLTDDQCARVEHLRIDLGFDFGFGFGEGGQPTDLRRFCNLETLGFYPSVLETTPLFDNLPASLLELTVVAWAPIRTEVKALCNRVRRPDWLPALEDIVISVARSDEDELGEDWQPYQSAGVPKLRRACETRGIKLEVEWSEILAL